MFHIDEAPKPDGMYDREKYKKADIVCNDKISAIAASADSFIVGRMSGQVLKFGLPYI